MTDPSPSEAPFTTVRAAREVALDDLQALRFVGPSTAETLANVDVTADDVRDGSVTYLQLVTLGVDPGVAGHLRREYSLSWSDEPAAGARLRRRARQVRHLRDAERSWIDRTWATDSTRAATPTAAPDGNGDALEAERAWRARSRRSTREPVEEREHEPEPPMSRSAPSDAPSTASRFESGVDPGEYTVSELGEVLELVDEPELLAGIRRAERDGADRATAIEAIERRMRQVGVDPDGVSVPGPGGSAPSGEAGTMGHPSGSTGLADARQRAARALDERLPEPIAASLLRARGRLTEAVESIGSADDPVTTPSSALHVLRTMDREKAHQLSIALLLGVTSFSFAEVFVTSLQPAYGPPLGALPLFLLTAIAGIISLPLRWWDTDGGDELALVTGVLGLLSVGLVALGFVGTVTFGAAMITLPAYALVALALLATTQPGRKPATTG